MEFLKECSVLKIEDILPFFPEFTLIDNFKDEICESLESYNKEIEELRDAMEISTQSANAIRFDIQKLSQSFGWAPEKKRKKKKVCLKEASSFVEGQQRCVHCEGPVLTRELFLFPCQHVLHSDCLANLMLEEFDDVQRKKYSMLQQQIRDLEQAAAKASNSGSSSAVAQAEEIKRGKLAKLKTTLDELIAAECPLCGLMNIKKIVKPFMDDANEARSWSLRSE